MMADKQLQINYIMGGGPGSARRATESPATYRLTRFLNRPIAYRTGKTGMVKVAVPVVVNACRLCPWLKPTVASLIITPLMA